MSTLEDRAREFAFKLSHDAPGVTSRIPDDWIIRALTVLLREVDAAATERATEAARDDLKAMRNDREGLRVDWMKACDELEAARAQAGQWRKAYEEERALRDALAGKVEAARGEVERAKHEAEENKLEWYAAVRDMRRALEVNDRQRERMAELAERLAVGERLVSAALEEGNACACLDKGTPDEYTCWSCEARAFLAAPAAPVTPAEPTHEESTDGGNTWRSVATPASGDIPLREGVLVRKALPAPATPMGEPRAATRWPCRIHGPASTCGHPGCKPEATPSEPQLTPVTHLHCIICGTGATTVTAGTPRCAGHAPLVVRIGGES